jgi:hypothetical protein
VWREIRAPATGSPGRHGSTGLEDEDEDEDEMMLYRELARHTSSTSLIFRVRQRSQSYRQSDKVDESPEGAGYTSPGQRGSTYFSFMAISTFHPVSAILSPVTSLLQTRFGMFSARADRVEPGLAKSDFSSIKGQALPALLGTEHFRGFLKESFVVNPDMGHVEERETKRF